MKKLPQSKLKCFPKSRALFAAAFLCAVAATTFGASLLRPGDRILAIDEDIGSRSRFPEQEGPANAIDGNANTKYLNSAGPNSGFIASSPLWGFSYVRGIQITTANDAPERDPKGWAIYGTFDDITSTNNSAGTNETWYLVAEGTFSLPDDRLAAAPRVSFDNPEAYISYRVVFTSLKGATTLMQVGDVQLFDDNDQPILAPDVQIVAIQLPRSESGYPSGESAARAIDGNSTNKYLNFGRENSGFIVTPSAGPSVLQSFTITTANDSEGRDPASYELYGSNEPILSNDNSTGNGGESWTLIASGTLDLPTNRLAAATPVAVNSTMEYRSYKMIFRENRFDGDDVDSIQFGEIQFSGTISPQGTSLLRPADRILAVDTALKVSSSFPAGENPTNILDANPGTKYLNGGGRLSGFIVTPARGASVVRSFVITTANDAPECDPAAWALYGTTDPVTSTNNSAGTNEQWSLIAGGSVTLPDTRLAVGPIVPVANEASYTSYKLIFTQLRSAGSTLMQVGDVQFHETTDASGTGVLGTGDAIVATALLQPQSSYNSSESPVKAIDGDVNTKYLNFGKDNSGFIVVPSVGPSIVRSVTLVSANDSVGRDPASFEIYGTRGVVTSTDNSQGTNENWVLIASGSVTLPDTRLTASDPVNINNTTAYSAYKLMFPQLKSTATVNSMQVAEVRFLGSVLRVIDVQAGQFNVTVKWESSSGATYNLYWSDDLVSWHSLATNVAGDDRLTTRTFSHPLVGSKTLFIKIGQP